MAVTIRNRRRSFLDRSQMRRRCPASAFGRIHIVSRSRPPLRNGSGRGLVTLAHDRSTQSAELRIGRKRRLVTLGQIVEWMLAPLQIGVWQELATPAADFGPKGVWLRIGRRWGLVTLKGNV